MSEPRTGASELAYRELRSRILTGALPPGAVLSEGALADELGVSRTPVREALQNLERDGLAVAGPRRQLIVGVISGDRRREILLLREALEELAIVEAPARVDDAQLDQLQLILIRQRRVAATADVELFLDLDDEFHLGIAAAAQLPMLSGFLRQLRAFVHLLGRDALRQAGRLDEVLAEHGEILAALEKRDREAALAAMRRHLAATRRLASESHAPTIVAYK